MGIHSQYVDLFCKKRGFNRRGGHRVLTKAITDLEDYEEPDIEDPIPRIIPDGWKRQASTTFPKSGKEEIILLEVTNTSHFQAKLDNYRNYFWYWDQYEHPDFWVWEFNCMTRRLTKYWCVEFSYEAGFDSRILS